MQIIQEITAAKDCEASDQDVGFNLIINAVMITDINSLVMNWVNEKPFYRRVSNDCEED